MEVHFLKACFQCGWVFKFDHRILKRSILLLTIGQDCTPRLTTKNNTCFVLGACCKFVAVCANLIAYWWSTSSKMTCLSSRFSWVFLTELEMMTFMVSFALAALLINCTTTVSKINEFSLGSWCVINIEITKWEIVTRVIYTPVCVWICNAVRSVGVAGTLDWLEEWIVTTESPVSASEIILGLLRNCNSLPLTSWAQVHRPMSSLLWLGHTISH